MQTSDIVTSLIPSFDQMQTGDVIAYCSAVISILAVIVAIYSAISSHKSANEAERLRRLQQGDSLGPFFENISNVIRRIKHGEKFKENDMIVLSCLESIGALKGRMPNDVNMQEVLEELSAIFSKSHPYGSELFVASVGYKTERFIKEHGRTIESFENIKREYISIG